MKNLKLIYTLISLLFFFNSTANTIEFNGTNEAIFIGSNLLIYEDPFDTLTINDVKNKKFFPSQSKIPNLGISKSAFWIKFSVKNNSDDENLLLELSLPFLDQIEFYHPNLKNGDNLKILGEIFPFSQRTYEDPNYLFDLIIPSGKSMTFFMKIKSNEGIQLPIKIGTKESILHQIKNRDILSGMYFGIMIVMILYNLFIFFSTKDKSYIYYVIYIILILLTQTSLQGYPFQYLWPNTPIIAKYSLFIFPSLVGIASMMFMNVFLKIKEQSKILYKISFILSLPYLISILFAFFKFYKISFTIMEINAMIVSIFMLYTGIKMIKKGYQPAKYFVAAWVVFLSGVIIYILKDFEILPFNNFTRYTMQIGSGIETVLLSFALAARINTYKKERLDALEENEHLIKEQNIILEQKVKERTAELNKAIEDLKQAQSQLVESEKMASLGQLTAGIAHEINNPINFVSSNVFPLKQDIEDLKSILNKYEEITESADLKSKLNEINQLKNELDYEILLEELDTIIHGIEDGAKRTAEIVSGLKNFSRLDESEFQSANVNDCINTTLKIIQPKLTDIKIITELENIPPIDCYPGKLNQFFLNTIDNAIYAVNAVKKPNHKGEIEIKTTLKNDHIIVTLKDNGIGMDETTKNKIFEPFFTTKDVGEGTGLGMSIAHGILEMHQAKIEIESEIDKGTQIKIFLPLTLPTWKE